MVCPQNVTVDKQAPSWLTPGNLTQLNTIKDFIERLLFNSVEKKRIAAGERREGGREEKGGREREEERKRKREGERERGRGGDRKEREVA